MLSTTPSYVDACVCVCVGVGCRAYFVEGDVCVGVGCRAYFIEGDVCVGVGKCRSYYLSLFSFSFLSSITFSVFSRCTHRSREISRPGLGGATYSKTPQ